MHYIEAQGQARKKVQDLGQLNTFLYFQEAVVASSDKITCDNNKTKKCGNKAAKKTYACAALAGFQFKELPTTNY